MARYVVSTRLARSSHGETRTNSWQMAQAASDFLTRVANVVGAVDPRDDRPRWCAVVESDGPLPQPLFAESDLIVEPEILHYPIPAQPPDFLQSDSFALALPVAPGPLRLDALVTGALGPIADATVHLYLRGPGRVERRLVTQTDQYGHAGFSYSLGYRASALVVIPYADYWPTVVRGPASQVQIECEPLPIGNPLGWWHDGFGIDTSNYTRDAGRGIRVGVVDTGVGPHSAVSHVVDAGAFLNQVFHPAPAGVDVECHGTHVCGIIAAYTYGGVFGGIAPGVSLSSARVFEKGHGADQGDIAEAIDALVLTHNVDLINLSFAAERPSQILQDAILAARDQGVLCIAAAGNSDSGVNFPAAFPDVVAVSALGRLGWAPSTTVSAATLPLSRDRFGDHNYYLANFSCYGTEITCTGPGVGVIAPVPSRGNYVDRYQAFDGTSMACPAVCGALAILLARDPNYSQLPRDETRASYARQVLAQSCFDVGLDPKFQGRGIPRV